MMKQDTTNLVQRHQEKKTNIKNGFVEITKNLARYRSKNNFV